MKLSTTIALAAALGITASTTICNAQQNQLFDYVQGIAGKYVTGWSDLDNRINTVQQEIADGVKAGQLTASQAADYRKELDQITQSEAAAKTSGRRMSITQSLTFGTQLSTLDANINAAATQTVQSLPDVDALRTQLQSQVDSALAAGQLNAQGAASIKAELQHNADIETAFKTETGAALTPRQVEILSDGLNKSKVNLDQQLKLAQSAVPALQQRSANIEAKIAAAVSSGKLSAADAQSLRAQLSKVTQQQAAFQTAGNGVLNGAQVLALVDQLDHVDESVDAHLATAATPAVAPPISASTDAVDQMRETIGNRINSLAANGKISAAHVARDFQNLNQIGSEEIALKSAPAGISAAQVNRLLTSLSQLNANIDSQIEAAATVAVPGNVPSAPGGAPPAYGGRSGGRFNVSNIPVSGSRSFADVAGYWGEQYINELASRNVIGGFPNGSFHPNDYITRAQFAAIVAHALNLPPTTSGTSFSDVPAGYWASGVIGAANTAGLIGGFPNGTFAPEDKITRAQALVILAKALGTNPNPAALGAYSDSSTVPSWANPSVSQAASARIIVNFPDPSQIRPNALATRGEVAALIYQTLTALGANLPPVRIGVLPGNL